MIEYRNECVGCSSLGLPCLGSSCANLHVPVHVCDECGTDDEQLYYFDDEELCIDCIKGRLEAVPA